MSEIIRRRIDFEETAALHSSGTLERSIFALHGMNGLCFRLGDSIFRKIAMQAVQPSAIALTQTSSRLAAELSKITISSYH
jgi:hypothetical protein